MPSFGPLLSRAAARRRWFDANPAIHQADQRTGECLLQLWPPIHLVSRPSCAFGRGPVQRRQQRFDFAKFRRTLMTDPVNRPQQKPQPDFLGHGSECLEIEALGAGIGARFERLAIPEREVALGAIHQHLHRRISPGETRRQPGEIARIAPLGDKRRHQRAQTWARERYVAIARIFGELDLCLLECRNEL